MNKFFANKKMLWALFGVCIFLTIWILLFKLCIPGGIHWNDIDYMSVEEWFWFGINPSKSLPIFCMTQELLTQYIVEQTINVVSLVPFGIIAGFVLKKRYVFLTGFVLIAGIELTQLFARMGGFDVIDAITNMLGVSLGLLVQRKMMCKMTSRAIDKACKICLIIFVPVAIFALYTLVFVFPATLPA